MKNKKKCFGFIKSFLSYIGKIGVWIIAVSGGLVLIMVWFNRSDEIFDVITNKQTHKITGVAGVASFGDKEIRTNDNIFEGEAIKGVELKNITKRIELTNENSGAAKVNQSEPEVKLNE